MLSVLILSEINQRCSIIHIVRGQIISEISHWENSEIELWRKYQLEEMRFRITEGADKTGTIIHHPVSL